MKIHKDLTAERWHSFSLEFQLANIGMDIERTIQWRNRNEHDYSMSAFYRALELLDCTIVNPTLSKPRRKELGRARELLLDYFMSNNEYGSSDEFWHKYFYAFSYAAALQRGR